MGFTPRLGHGGRAGPGEHKHDEQDRNGQRGQLQPVLEGLDEGDGPHPPATTVSRRRRPPPPAPPTPAGPVVIRIGQGGAVELRDDVEPADQHHHHAGDAPDRPGVQPGLGEIGNGVRAGTPQGGRHKEQQHQVAGGVADGEPQGVRPGEQDQPGDAEEARGGKVLPADRRRVPPGPHGPGRDVEVPGGARDPEAVETDDSRGQRDGGEGREAHHRVHRRLTCPRPGPGSGPRSGPPRARTARR